MRQNVIVDDQLGLRLGYGRAVSDLSVFVTPAGLDLIDATLASGLSDEVCLPVVDARGKRRTMTVKFLRAGGTTVMTPADPMTSELLVLEPDGLTAAEAALRRSELRLSLALRAAEMGIWEYDVQAGTMTWSEKVAEFYGIPMAEFQGTLDACMALIHPEDRERVLARMRASLRGDGDYMVEHRVWRPDGQTLWVHVRGDVIRDGDGAPVMMIGTVWDCTSSHEKRQLLADTEAALRRSIESMELAADAAGIGLWEVDFETREMTWDARMCRLYDVPGPGFQGPFEGWDERVHPEDRKRVGEETLHAAKTGRSHTGFRIFWRDGTQRHIESFAHAVVSPNGEPTRLIGLCMDVTERRIAELREVHRNQVLEALLRGESEVEVLETLVRGLEQEDPTCRIAFMRVDATGRRLRSAAGPSLPEEYFQAADNLEIREGNGSCGTAAALRRIVVAEDVLEDPAWASYREITSRSGFRACWSIPIVGAGDKLLGTLGAYYNEPRKPQERELRRLMEAADFAALAIARKLKDEELERRERLLEMTGAIAGVGGWELDLSTGKKSLTLEMARMHGLPPGCTPEPEEFIKVYTPESQRLLVDAVGAAIQDWKSWHLELELDGQDAERRWVWSEGRAEVIDGETVRLFGAVRDLRAEKVAERERQKLQEQLIQAQKMESVGRLAGGVAHDFNNILSVILGHAELAMGDVEAGTQLFEDLAEIKQAAERSAALTQQLLAFARRQPIMPRKVNVNETIGGMVNMLRRLIGEQISLDWISEPNLWDVYVDPAQVDQILANLCVNARDAIGGPGTVEIHTQNVQLWGDRSEDLGELAPGEYVCLTVKDNGVGISSEDLPHVFEPFFTTKNVGEGTGLGLSTVYGIVRQNHGAVTVTSVPGEGTAVSVYLPRVFMESSETSEEMPKSDRLKPCRVLLVEDEPALLKLGRRMLEGLGHEVFTASRPSEAVRISERIETLDLLVTDIIMPEMNGRQLSDLIETHHPKMRKLFISGYAAEVLAEEGALGKGTIFLPKPFSFDDFRVHVSRALEGHGT